MSLDIMSYFCRYVKNGLFLCFQDGKQDFRWHNISHTDVHITVQINVRVLLNVFLMFYMFSKPQMVCIYYYFSL